MAQAPQDTYLEVDIEEYVVGHEPYFAPVGDEIELFEAAYHQQLPVLLKGPTGCGKTRFIEYMSWRLGRPLTVVKKKGKSSQPQASVNGVAGAPDNHRLS